MARRKKLKNKARYLHENIDRLRYCLKIAENNYKRLGIVCSDLSRKYNACNYSDGEIDQLKHDISVLSQEIQKFKYCRDQGVLYFPENFTEMQKKRKEEYLPDPHYYHLASRPDEQ